MNISNQNNGHIGQTLHHEFTMPKGSVADLARRLAHILSHGTIGEHLLCEYFQTKPWEAVQSSDIVATVEGASKILK